MKSKKNEIESKSTKKSQFLSRRNRSFETMSYAEQMAYVENHGKDKLFTLRENLQNIEDKEREM